MAPRSCTLHVRAARLTNGLTLVELLLAITLFSVLLASATGLIRNGIEAQLHWGSGLASYQRLEHGVEQLARDVEAARKLYGVPFQGSATALEFASLEPVATEEGAPAAPAWVRVTYHLGAEGETGALVRERAVWKADGTDPGPAQARTLMPLASCAFTFAALDPSGHLVWIDAWDGAKHGVPRFVRFDYTLPMAGMAEPLHMVRTIRNPAGTVPALEAP